MTLYKGGDRIQGGDALSPEPSRPTTQPASYLPASTNVGDAVTIRFARSDTSERNAYYCSRRTRYVQCFSDIDDFPVKHHAFPSLVSASGIVTRSGMRREKRAGGDL